MGRKATNAPPLRWPRRRGANQSARRGGYVDDRHPDVSLRSSKVMGKLAAGIGERDIAAGLIDPENAAAPALVRFADLVSRAIEASFDRRAMALP